MRPLIVWLPFDEEHPYYASFHDIQEQPDDGFELIDSWIGEDSTEVNEQGKRKRLYWLQLLARGAHDRKAILIVFGVPVPPEVNEMHVEDAVSQLGWDDFAWRTVRIGKAEITKRD